MTHLLIPFKDPEHIIFRYGSQYNTYLHKTYNSCDEVQVGISNILITLKADYAISNIYFLIDPEKKYNVEEKLNGKLIKCVGLESYCMPLEEAFDSLLSILNNHIAQLPRSVLVVIISYVAQEKCDTYKTLIGYSMYKVNYYDN